jgi:hypothetical protein
MFNKKQLTNNNQKERGNKMGDVQITRDEIEQFKLLQKKIKDAKSQSKEMVEKIMNPAFNSIDIDAVFEAIALSGGERISRTIKTDDGRKLNLCFRDVTNLGKKDSKED